MPIKSSLLKATTGYPNCPALEICYGSQLSVNTTGNRLHNRNKNSEDVCWAPNFQSTVSATVVLVGSDSETELHLAQSGGLGTRLLLQHTAPSPVQRPGWLTPHRLTGGWSILCWLTAFQGVALTAWDCWGRIEPENAHLSQTSSHCGWLGKGWCGDSTMDGSNSGVRASGFVPWELHKSAKGEVGPASREERPPKMAWGKDYFHAWGLPKLST